MRINADGLHPTRNSTDLSTPARPGAAPPTVPAAQDSVTLSPRAQLLQAARRALDAAPTVRPEVVAGARGRLEAGASWDGGALAAAMIRVVAEHRA